MNRINKIENKIKFKAFGKVTINNKKKDIVEEKEAEGKTEEERTKEMFELKQKHQIMEQVGIPKVFCQLS